MAALNVADDTRSESARVQRVIDGDTILVQIGQRYDQKVRYIGIDAPEMDPVQPFGPEAAQANRDLVYPKPYQYVRLEKDVTDRDRYGRLLRYVFVEANGTDLFVNAELVRQGLAKSAPYRPDIARQKAIDQAQDEAYTGGRGMWKPTTSTLPHFQIAIRRIRQLLSRWRS